MSAPLYFPMAKITAVKFKRNWKFAEAGVHVLCFEAGQVVSFGDEVDGFRVSGDCLAQAIKDGAAAKTRAPVGGESQKKSR